MPLSNRDQWFYRRRLCPPPLFLYRAIAGGMVIWVYPMQKHANSLAIRTGGPHRGRNGPPVRQRRESSVTASRCPVCGNMSSTRTRSSRIDGIAARSFASVTGLQLE